MLSVITAACSNDDKADKLPLPSTALTCTDKGVSWMSFEWAPVEGAYQYSVTLTDPEGRTEYGGVTNSTQITIEELPDNTLFTATLVAYAPLQADNSASEPATLQVATNAIIPLATPEKFQVKKQGSNVMCNWKAVENADWYLLTYGLSGQEANEEYIYGTTNYRMSTELPEGTYTFTLIAGSDYEEWGDSEAATATLEI